MAWIGVCLRNSLPLQIFKWTRRSQGCGSVNVIVINFLTSPQPPFEPGSRLFIVHSPLERFCLCVITFETNTSRRAIQSDINYVRLSSQWSYHMNTAWSMVVIRTRHVVITGETQQSDASIIGCDWGKPLCLSELTSCWATLKFWACMNTRVTFEEPFRWQSCQNLSDCLFIKSSEKHR